MGLKDMLKGAADNEGALINKEVNKVAKKEEPEYVEQVMPENVTDESDTTSVEEEGSTTDTHYYREETPKQKKTVAKKSTAETKKASSGGKVMGRKPNSTKNIENRKQYSITMRPSTYERAVEKAIDEDIPFAKFVERAVIEYMNNHP